MRDQTDGLQLVRAAEILSLGTDHSEIERSDRVFWYIEHSFDRDRPILLSVLREQCAELKPADAIMQSPLERMGMESRIYVMDSRTSPGGGREAVL